MKKAGFIRKLICILLVFAFVGSSASAVTDESLSVSKGFKTIDGQVPLHSGDERLAKTYSALLFDITNDVVIYADNPDGQFSPAGLVKIMTGWLLAEQANMEEEVTVKQEILDSMYSGSWGLNLYAGEILSMEDLLYATVVLGSNLAASVAADHMAGSEDAFVKMMNERAAELGCTGTHFVNVHGLSDDLQVTTARDVAKIIVAAMENDVFAEAFGTYVYRIYATNMSDDRRISSENFLFNRELGSNHFERRATGSRMGMTGNGEINLVVTAESNNTELVSIVLGSTSEINPNGEEGCYKEARILLDKGFNEHTHFNVLNEDQILQQFKVPNGDCDVTGRVTESVRTVLPVGTTDAELNYRFTLEGGSLKAPISKDDKIASVEVWFQNVCVADALIYALHDVSVQEAATLEEITPDKDLGAFTIMIVAMVIVGLLIILLFGRQIIFRIIRKRRIKRHRRRQRRSR